VATFQDKTVLITGAGKGLGRSLAIAFAEAGANVAANDLTPTNLDTTLDKIKAAGGSARTYLADVAKSMPVHSMVQHIVDDWGSLDVVVNNAAVAPKASLLIMDEWDWQRTLDVNLSGPFWLAQAAGQAMEAQREGGVILNLIAQPDWLLGLRDRSAYLASQYGMIGLTLAMAHELSSARIRINGLLLGAIESDLEYQDIGDSPRKIDDEGSTGAPLSKIIEQALFLCSPEASHLNGQIMAITKATM
jgi:NAD(P)-dependent dehydrogenase (short-subunit alcohol dehydrogenase family)